MEGGQGLLELCVNKCTQFKAQVSDIHEACRIFVGLGLMLHPRNKYPEKPISETYECEAKMEVGRFDVLRDMLRRFGARYIQTVEETNDIYDTLNKNLKSTGRTLRIRESTLTDTRDVKTCLTFKGPKLKDSRLKVRPEFEVWTHPLNMASILQELGYKKVFTYYKERETYNLYNSEICLDTLLNTGKTYVEIEGPEEEVWSIRSELGLDTHEIIKKGYPSLCREST